VHEAREYIFCVDTPGVTSEDQCKLHVSYSTWTVRLTVDFPKVWADIKAAPIATNDSIMTRSPARTAGVVPLIYRQPGIGYVEISVADRDRDGCFSDNPRPRLSFSAGHTFIHVARMPRIVES